MRTRIQVRGRRIPYVWRLVAAVAVGSILAVVTGHTRADRIELAGSSATRVHWSSDVPVRGNIAGDTGRDVKAVRRAGVGRLAARPAATGGVHSMTSQVVPPPWEFLTGQGASQNFDFPGSYGGTLLDVQVAASRTHVCVTARAALACYDKAGDLVSLGHGSSPAVELAATFFTQSGITLQSAFDGSPNQVKDGRIIFDQHTNRFYMFFQERGTTPRLLIAASRSEDPNDGWYTWADVTTQYNTPNGTLNGHDYDFIGLNENYLLASSDMMPCGLIGGNWSCSNPQRILVHFIYNLSELAAGHLYNRGSWYTGTFAAPVADQGNDANAYWIARQGNQSAIIYQLNTQGYINSATAALPNASSPIPSTTPSNEPGGQVLEYGIIGNAYRNAAKLSSIIAAVSDDATVWPGQPTTSYAPRLDTFNIASAVFNNSSAPSVTVTRDRIFGWNSSGDPAGSVFDYGDPGVAFTDSGDIGVGELRSNPATYPQLRGSIWYAGQSDISPSQLLFASSGPLGSIHMSGAAVDPSTANGMYVAQVVGEDPTVTCAGSSPAACGALIGVAKIEGATKPDLIATQLTGPASLQPLQTTAVTATVLNQGDATSPATVGQLYANISGSTLINPGTDYALAAFSIPSLSPGQSVNIPVTFQTPNVACQCVVGAVITPSGSENSTANNLNPYLDGLHGNIAMTLNPIINGGFRTGNTTGWSTTGIVAALPAGGGTYMAQLGSASPTAGDSTISQTFIAPTDTATLSFDYQMSCPDTVFYDWATATLTDNTTHTTTTVLPKTCQASPVWTYAGTPIVANHSYTLTLYNHDDNYPADPTYTDYTNITTS